MRRAFDGPDAEPVDAAALADLDWETATFRFAPTLRVAAVTTNAAAIWSAIANDEEPPPVARLPATANLLVWRMDLSPRFRTLDAAEADALSLAFAGATFGEICASRPANEDETVQLAAAWLSQWLQDGIVVAVAERPIPN